MQTTLKGAIARKTNKMLFEKDGKIYCHIDNLRLWPKNPKVPNQKAQKVLTNSIKKFGLCDPLKITPDGEIIGGNQRFRVLKELSFKDKKYEWVWVEELELWTDQERFEFALLDNFEAGEYVEQELKAIVDTLVKQQSIFGEMNLKIGEGTKINQLVLDLSLSKQELQFKEVKKNLKSLGINDETIKTLETMTSFSKINEDLEDVDIKGCITGQKTPMLFWFDDEVVFNQMKEVFGTGHKDRYDVNKLINLTEAQLNVKFPTSEDELLSLVKQINNLEKDIKDHKELGGDWSKIENKKNIITEKFKSLYSKTYPQEASEILF